MPTPPVVPGVCRWRILGTLANAAPWGVRFYTAYTGGPPTNTVMLAIAEAIASAWNTHCCPAQSEDITTTTVDGVDLTSDMGASATAEVDYPGGVAAAAVSNQIPAIIKYDIDRRYRGGKPKMYFPGPSVDAVLDDSHFTTTYVNALASAFTAFINEVTAISESGTNINEYVNVSYYKGFTAVENMITGRWRNVPTYRTAADVIIDPVPSVTVDQLFGSQRRRRTA